MNYKHFFVWKVVDDYIVYNIFGLYIHQKLFLYYATQMANILDNIFYWKDVFVYHLSSFYVVLIHYNLNISW